MAHLRSRGSTVFGPAPLLYIFADQHRHDKPKLALNCTGDCETAQGFERTLRTFAKAGVTIGDMADLLCNQGYQMSGEILHVFGVKAEAYLAKQQTAAPSVSVAYLAKQQPAAPSMSVYYLAKQQTAAPSMSVAYLCPADFPHFYANTVGLTSGEFYGSLRLLVNLPEGPKLVYMAILKKHNPHVVESDYTHTDYAVRCMAAHPIGLTIAGLADDLEALAGDKGVGSTMARVAGKLRALDDLLNGRPIRLVPLQPQAEPQPEPKPEPAPLKPVPEDELDKKPECPICMQERAPRIARTCGHTACGGDMCLPAFSGATCPVCKTPGNVFQLFI